MANFEKNHPLNLAGPLFVDTTCIDCGTCYHLGPEIFKEKKNQSTIAKQPENLNEWSAAKRAMVSCPTNSIGVKAAPEIFKSAEINLPLLISENVYYCGYTSKDSYGASSYLIVRPEGNYLIDSPRFGAHLVSEFEKLGGIHSMFLTHQDDVADHALFAEHFKCQRVIHEADVNGDTQDVEHILKTSELPQDWDHDLKIIPVPGHTRGHIAFLYQNKFLFSGDHIFYDPDSQELTSSKGVCWYSWTEQIKSTKSLLQEDFEWIMPGHGGWGHLGSQQMKHALENLIQKMEQK